MTDPFDQDAVRRASYTLAADLARQIPPGTDTSIAFVALGIVMAGITAVGRHPAEPTRRLNAVERVYWLREATGTMAQLAAIRYDADDIAGLAAVFDKDARK